MTAPSLIIGDREQLSWGWPIIYVPSTEQNPDSNHMIRRHLRSRALWSHHANWERKLEKIWQLTNQIRDNTKNDCIKQASNKQLYYTEDYVNTALCRGFEVACGRTLRLDYKIPESKIGMSFGAHLIETSVTSTNSRNLLKKEHQELIFGIAITKDIKNLSILWSEISETQEAMKVIVTKALRSNDILYPCRFCKHLWK